MKQPHMFHAALGEGLQEHFIENQLLHDVFDTTIAADPKKNPFSGVGKVCSACYFALLTPAHSNCTCHLALHLPRSGRSS